MAEEYDLVGLVVHAFDKLVESKTGSPLDPLDNAALDYLLREATAQRINEESIRRMELLEEASRTTMLERWPQVVQAQMAFNSASNHVESLERAGTYGKAFCGFLLASLLVTTKSRDGFDEYEKLMFEGCALVGRFLVGRSLKERVGIINQSRHNCPLVWDTIIHNPRYVADGGYYFARFTAKRIGLLGEWSV